MGTLGEHVASATAGGFVDAPTADRLEAEYYATHPHRLSVDGNALRRTYTVVPTGIPDTKFVLAPAPEMTADPPLAVSLAPATIVPRMPTQLVPEYEAVLARYTTVPGVFSPAPFSIAGIGTVVGTLLVHVGKRLAVEIAMEILSGPFNQNQMERIGHKAHGGASMRIRTNAGEGRGRHMNLRGRDGATPGDQNDAYDEPDDNTWYQPWTWA